MQYTNEMKLRTKKRLTIHMLSTPPRMAEASFERNGFQTLYSTFVPSSFCRSKMRVFRVQTSILTNIFTTM